MRRNRLEELRIRMNELILNNDPQLICNFIAHMYGVSKFCTLLALKRKLNPELAATCGMLHDIYYMTGGNSEEHAIKGAVQAEGLLKEMGEYSDEEIKLIVTAISHHSDKRSIHDVYAELLKDADVMDHCFYNPDSPVAEQEKVRYRQLLEELRLDPS